MTYYSNPESWRWPLWPWQCSLKCWLTPYKAAQLDWWWGQWCGEPSWGPAQRSFSGSWAIQSNEPEQSLQTHTHTQSGNITPLVWATPRVKATAGKEIPAGHWCWITSKNQVSYLAGEKRRKFGAEPHTARRKRTPLQWHQPGSSLISEESRTPQSKAGHKMNKSKLISAFAAPQ